MNSDIVSNNKYSLTEFETVAEYTTVLKYLYDAGKTSRWIWVGGGFDGSDMVWINSQLVVDSQMFGSNYQYFQIGYYLLIAYNQGSSPASPYGSIVMYTPGLSDWALCEEYL